MTKQTDSIDAIVQDARRAYHSLATASTQTKNRALQATADTLQNERETIIEANQKDLKHGQEQGLTEALLDRLKLTPDRIDSMIDGIEQVISLEDPVGEITGMKRRPNGLKIGQQRVPLGVIGMIYESRPNVTVDASVLCLKAGNATVLRGGSEAKHSNYLLVDLLQEAIEPFLPESTVQILRNQDHSLVNELLTRDQYVDVIIPRGGENLIEAVTEQSTIPVIKHYKGICHTYVSDQADLEMAHEIVINAKTQRTSVCNAMETLLLHEDLPDDFIRDLFHHLQQQDIELRVDSTLHTKFTDSPFRLEKAEKSDWNTEYLDSILSVRSVQATTDAIHHINEFGSNHSDAIVTQNYDESERFLNEVDSAAVYVNASTRFTDGYEFGLGAEIGISTERLHARGPMGLKELTLPKYVIYGQGQTRH